MRSAPPMWQTPPARLKIIGEVAAGRPFDRAIGPGEAARIFTGGVMPAGADTVVIQEHTKRDGDWVDVGKAGGQGPPHPRQGPRLHARASCCSPPAAD